MYIGKATSLKHRVHSYFTKAHDSRIEELVSRIARIEYTITPSVLDALILEANEIKARRPYFNILARDDKSFIFLVITNETFPKPLLLRGHELAHMGIDPFRPKITKHTRTKFKAIFGPYTSARSLQKALDLIRKVIPWSRCEPLERTRRKKPCFDVHLKKCPGVCTGSISKQHYRHTIQQLILFFQGKKIQLIKQLRREMLQASNALQFEIANRIKRKIFVLEHIQDVALLSKEDVEFSSHSPLVREGAIDLNGRIEAYDISNISGKFAVGSMVVFVEGKPAKALYRRFRIKTVIGANDVAMIEEVIRRRLNRAQKFSSAWPLPELFVIDGGVPQVNRVQAVLDEFGITLSVMGIAKGFDRKQDRLVYNEKDRELQRVALRGYELFQRARDEAHRFAVSYHRLLRRKQIPTF